MANHADVAVVGGGPAGALCAALLARRGYRVVLITDSRRRPSWPDLLSPAAATTLDRVGFPTADLAAVARPCQGIVDRWVPGPPTFMDFELFHLRCGWIVDRVAFDNRLVRFAAKSGVCVSASPCRARLAASPRNFEAAMTVQREGADEDWVVAFVVDATGAAGRLLPPGENPRLWFDRLLAIRVALAPAVDPPNWLHLATSSAGWWYSFTPPHGLAQGVFMTDSDLLPRCPSARQLHLAAEFRDAFPGRPSAPVFLEPITVRDARTTCPQRFWTGRWLPIGDALISFDPLTGAGLERAFGSAEDGAKLVSEFLQSGSFRAMEIATLERIQAFEDMRGELHRYYRMASDQKSQLRGPFWQRRGGFPGEQESE